MATPSSDRGAPVKVLYGLKRNAKHLKVSLEKNGWMNKDYRMTAVDPSASVDTPTGIRTTLSRSDTLIQQQQCIAIPVLDGYFSSLSSFENNSGAMKAPLPPNWSKEMVIATGMQFCTFSSALLGNNNQLIVASRTSKGVIDRSGSGEKQLTTRVQQALLFACVEIIGGRCCDDNVRKTLICSIEALSTDICPKKLELIGDDKTLVIPRKAFVLKADSANNEDKDNDFTSLLRFVATSCEPSTCLDTEPTERTAMSTKTIIMEIWKQLARMHGSPRVARRGDIDPDSRIRESGHRLLWPAAAWDVRSGNNSDGIPLETGPGSPGWITVTEQGIKQSFDLTRVMFSRGNITEKIRFGRLVQTGDVLLDMYAGIGYYTLPALVHGKAKHVYACEWNEYAANALRYNLKANKQVAAATVFVGDCRAVARNEYLTNMVDRVSLGLLPSSEGGWKTAVHALRDESGGWLHVHGNVPDREIENWQFWLCDCLSSIVKEQNNSADTKNRKRDGWVALCWNVQRVKSYAPMIHHYVADVFVGPSELRPQQIDMGSHLAGIRSGVTGLFRGCSAVIDVPSCALSSDGKLNQKWMRQEQS